MREKPFGRFLGFSVESELALGIVGLGRLQVLQAWWLVQFVLPIDCEIVPDLNASRISGQHVHWTLLDTLFAAIVKPCLKHDDLQLGRLPLGCSQPVRAWTGRELVNLCSSDLICENACHTSTSRSGTRLSFDSPLPVLRVKLQDPRLELA